MMLGLGLVALVLFFGFGFLLAIAQLLSVYIYPENRPIKPLGINLRDPVQEYLYKDSIKQRRERIRQLKAERKAQPTGRKRDPVQEYLDNDIE